MSATGDPDATRLPDRPSDSPDHIGPYHLLQKLAEGGMGEVWVAEQREPIRRTVALKIIKVGMDTRQVVARFEAERQALAVMDHPAIAKVLDAGATAQGRPYFVMEYIKGDPITTFCDRERLATDERLALFIRVCEGVQHAHQKGIIHRDLKPSNVLVTTQDGQSVPKIIDFGIAKATAYRLTEQTVFTELGVLVGTPEYMSPEQAEMGGLDVDTRTDIYALGVLLYELLTGSLPFESKALREKALDEIRRTIREVDPPRPSTRVTQMGPASAEAAKLRHTEPARLASQLRGDLDWITMKALEKTRSRRYDTAMGMANDVGRHLRHEPVSAGPPGTAYRMKKFIRRHRFGVAAAVVLVLLLGGFGLTMAVQAGRIARERDRANREAETARQVSSFLVGLFEVAKPSEAAANSLTAREILDKGAAKLHGQLQDQPATRAALLETVGTVYESVGLYAKAESLLEEALTLRRRTFGSRSIETASSLATLSRVLEDQARYAEAERMEREALAVYRDRLGNDSVDVAETLRRLGWTLALGKADYARAEAAHRESVRLLRKLVGDSDPRMASSLNGLGVTLLFKGDYRGAEQAFRDAREIGRETLGPGHPYTLDFAENLATVLLKEGNLAEAEAIYREALQQDVRSRGPEHPDIATTLNNLGAVVYRQRRFPEAEALYREALRIKQKALGADHPEVAMSLDNLGQVLDAQGQYAGAEESYREALAIKRRALGSDHPDVAVCLTHLSGTLRHLGRFHEAETAAREALDVNRRKSGFDDSRTKESEGALGAALCAEKRWAEAEPLLLSYEAALESRPDMEGDLRNVREQVIAMYLSWGKPDKAAEWRRKLPPT